MAFRMPLACEDVSATPRRKMTARRALKIFEGNHGKCVICGEKIDGIREDWFIEHPHSLGMGGSDDDKDLGPAHYSHKAGKDAEDAAKLKKARDNKQRHIGIAPAPSTPIRSAGFRPTKRSLDRAKRAPRPTLPPRQLYRKASTP